MKEYVALLRGEVDGDRLMDRLTMTMTDSQQKIQSFSQFGAEIGCTTNTPYGGVHRHRLQLAKHNK